QPWRTFLANHVNHIVAADLFVAPTATCRLSFVLVLLAQLCARTFEHSRASSRHCGGRSDIGGTAPILSGVEWRPRTIDDHPGDNYRTPSTAVRSPASGSGPTHRGRHHRHESRRSARNPGGWLGDQRGRVAPGLGVHGIEV